MYARGIYRFSNLFYDCLYEEWCLGGLEMFNNTDIAVDEILSPLYRIIEDVKKGILPDYVAREVFEQRISAIERGPYPALNYLPEYDNLWLNADVHELAHDIFCEEEPLWTVLVDADSWSDFYPSPGSDHGFDPELITATGLANRPKTGFVAFIDWHSSTLTVVRSDFVGPRKYLSDNDSCAETISDLDKENKDSYVLPPSMEDDVLRKATEYFRVHHSWRAPYGNAEIQTDDEILEEIENEYGYIPGSLPSSYVGVPSDAVRNGLA